MDFKYSKVCREHSTKKEVMCKRCKQIFCPKCVINHLQEAHNVDYLTNLDSAVEVFKGEIQERINKYKGFRDILRNERRELDKKIFMLTNNTELDLIYDEAVRKIRERLQELKKNRRSFVEVLRKVNKKLENIELDFEIKEYREKKVLESVKEGKNDKLILIYEKKLEINFEEMLKEIKTMLKAGDKGNSEVINVDDHIEDIKKKALENAYKSIENCTLFVNESKIKKSMEKKLTKFIEYKEEARKTQETIIRLKGIAENISIQQKDAKIKLEEIRNMIVENNNIYKEIQAKKYVRCDNCNEICCMKCYAICLKCKKDTCSKCINKCTKCICDVCRKCFKPCPDCNEIACIDCTKKPTCINSSVIYLDESVKGIYTICSPIGGYKKLCYFDLKEKKLKDLNIEVPFVCGIIQINNKIFITGGVKGSTAVNNTFEFMEASKTFIQKYPMTNARCSHGLVKISNNCFNAIGGYNNCFLSECESYNIEKNQWNSLPSLNEKKDGVGCILINSSILYCFGGWADKAINTLEKMEINLLSGKWDIIHLSENEALDGIWPELIQISSNEIIIFRGSRKSGVYIFDIKANTIKEYVKIKPLTDCIRGIPYRIGNLIYAIGEDGHIHIFNPLKQEYASIEFSKTQ